MAAKERILRSSAALPTTNAAGIVPTPFQFVLTGAESLRVTVVTGPISTPQTVDVSSRLWREDVGQVAIATDSIAAAGVGAVTTRDLPLVAGALLNVRLGVSDPSVKYGALWVRVQLVLGQTGATIVLGTLVQGYLSAINDLAWPGSPLEKTHDAKGVIRDGFWSFMVAPARIEAAVPSGARWRVIGGTFTLTTSAVAGARAILMEAVSATGSFYWEADAAPDQGPSDNVIYNVGAGMPPTSLVMNHVAYLPWPTDLELTAGDKIVAVIGGAQAGDFIAASGLLIREWIDR